jgi:hypothetical protein
MQWWSSGDARASSDMFVVISARIITTNNSIEQAASILRIKLNVYLI